MRDCRYCKRKLYIDPADGKEYSDCICFKDNNYLGMCFVDEGVKCCFYELPEDDTCRNITEENPVDDFICSKCGIHLYDWIKKDDEDCYEYEFKYCPNCGAKVY